MTVRRVLVAIDASPGSATAAEATARLAARLRADLVGVFVEDVRLLRLVESPLAREVDTLTASRRLPQSIDARRQLRLQGARAREKLRRIAEREGVRWSFRRERGSVSRRIANAVEETDIVGLGSVGWSHRPQRVLGLVATELLARRRGSTLLVKRATEIKPPIVVLFDGSPAAERALRIAAQLAVGEKDGIAICARGVSPEILDRALAEAIPDPERRLAVRRLEPGDWRPSKLVALAPGTVLLPLAGELADRDALLGLLEELDCPVLLVS